MPRPPSVWLQVSGYRFLLRRLEAALLTGDASAPVRGRSAALAFGYLVAALAAAGCALLAVLRPHPAFAQERLVMTRESGALYVRVGDTWHPVPNIASARLIAGADLNPRPVRGSDLARTRRGPLLGIPGAPEFLGAPLSGGESVWTICDADGVTTVVAAPAVGSPAGVLAPDAGVLVAPVSGSPTYLLYNGLRAVVDLADHSVVRALRLEGRAPRPVSQSLLDAVPEAPAIAAPRVRDAGRPVAGLPGFAAGSVLRIARADGDEYYAVLTGGVQRIGQVAADILRFSDSRGTAGATTVAPDAIRAIPTVDWLPVGTFPDRPPMPARAGGVVCAAWGPSGVTLLAGGEPPLQPGQAPVALAQADGRGPALDAVYLPPGRSAYVRAGGIRFLIIDTGVRFAVRDDEDARDLGLPAPLPAPWPVIAALPSGPELSRQGASVARDAGGVPP
ncbi:type VII secretion protein EccB [Mycobacterium sp. Marseille-P9652]|uniref:type VII secretion protein EccB n=1 Tax=Mycobacterium sp. Marseille-P9652 TaxID=2654950 RepID=UPI0012E77056|nr:type VII secretion protein EccB [Mycobacterium sp. Marseille-P9652]